jgi:elongation factor P
MVIVEDGQLYTVVDRDLNTPGNWRAILQLKLKNLLTGSVINRRVRPDDKVEQAYLDKPRCSTRTRRRRLRLHGRGTFDQTTLDRDWVGDQMGYLKENMNARVVFCGASRQPELPPSVS